MFKKIFFIIITLIMVVTMLNAKNVTIANDQLGNFLIAPFYIAKNNICTNIKVFNTNETNSILAKIAIREQISSQEVDLPIFLSPGDIWSGTICETDGKVLLTSMDDSNHPSITKALKRGKNLTTQSKNAGHNNIDFTKGYIEVYPIAQFIEGKNEKIDKKILLSRWNQLINNNLSMQKLKKGGVDNYSLSGLVSFQSQDKTTATIPMIAFKNAHNTQITGNEINYSSDAEPNKLLGKSKTKQILKLLQKDIVSFTYNNSGVEQYVQLVFPFGYKKNQSRKFQLTVRDTSENKNIVDTVIFSPVAIKDTYHVEKEVTIISVNELIKLTSNPDKFINGMIQLKEIVNENNIQLGINRTASFIATLSRVSENTEKEKNIIDIRYISTK